VKSWANSSLAVCKKLHTCCAKSRAPRSNIHGINALRRDNFGNQSANEGPLGNIEAEIVMGNIFKAARMLAFGGCRHKKMGWPIWLEGNSYRVCVDCGIKRLFDERTLRAYGPYSYDIRQLSSGRNPS